MNLRENTANKSNAIRFTDRVLSSVRLQLAVSFQLPEPPTGWFLSAGGVREIKFIGCTCVDDRNTVPGQFAAEGRAGIGLVDMPVDHDGRTPLIQQRAETLKAAMAKIFLIADPTDRSMRQQDIKAAG